MKILYALQGTGNGHLARAQKMLPILENYGELDVFISGSNSQLKLENYQFKHHKGLSLFYNLCQFFSRTGQLSRDNTTI